MKALPRLCYRSQNAKQPAALARWVVAALMATSTAASAATTITVRARADMAANVGATMALRVNGALIDAKEVRDTTWQNYTFTTPDLAAGARIDVMFTNDLYANGQDRNLYVESITVNGVTTAATAPGVTFDAGFGAAAFDGQGVMAGRTGLYWNGALRFTLAGAPGAFAGDYKSNLELIRRSTVRNLNQDKSAFRDTPQAQLVIANHLGPRTDYLNNPGGNPEQAFPVAEGGQFRTSCEFSHFAYDDPLVHPGKPGAAHLHMFFGNTDVNAFSTYQSLKNSGGSTCNGGELNRTGYWAPALFDAAGNVRIPERIGVYYKGYGLARGASQVYPEGAAMIATDLHTVSYNAGGAEGEFSFRCSDQWRGAREPAANTIPDCDGDRFLKEYGVTENPYVMIEMHVKFPNCWNGQDASNPANWQIPKRGGWFYSDCEGWATFPNIEYIIQYRVNIGETTAGWFIASDIDPASRKLTAARGSTVHADWWGAWQPEINRQWVDNCTNYKAPGDVPSDCGHGYLSDGGPDGNNPFPGPALKLRSQYKGPTKTPAATLYKELCPAGPAIAAGAEAAYCTPGAAHKH
jgi:Domain of unknown function (DUF1996)/Ca-dependent carbohydrate-binding module xylan-binding